MRTIGIIVLAGLLQTCSTVPVPAPPPPTPTNTPPVAVEQTQHVQRIWYDEAGQQWMREVTP